MRKDLAHAFIEYLRQPWFAGFIIFIAILITIPFPSVFSDLVLIVSVFIFSDFTADIIVRGGKGAPQIRITGTTKIQPEGYVLIAFFSSIIITSIIIDFASQTISSFALSVISDPAGAIISAIVLSLAVYGDMRLRFYWRSKTKQ